MQGEAFEALLLREPRRGELITLRDFSGREFRARITELGGEGATIYVFQELKVLTEPPFDLLLLQALPDKERMELIIQKVTELGVKVIVPFKSQRSISLTEREARQPKAHRWQHIALKAMKQCRRLFLPYVAPYCSFTEALRWGQSAQMKIMLLEGEVRGLASVLKSPSPPPRVALMVGPEGGWEDEEVSRARKEGFITVGLGGRILRVETATITACAILQYRWGGLGGPSSTPLSPSRSFL